MSAVTTPPPRSPVAFFGESHFAWAPTKPKRPKNRNACVRSLRSLDFSNISIDDDEKDENIGIQLRNRGRRAVFGIYKEETMPQTPDQYQRNLNSNASSNSSLVTGRNTQRRIDFTRVSLNDRDPGYFTEIVGPSRSSSISSLETTRSRKRQAGQELLPGNTKSGRKHCNGNGSSSTKNERLVRLMR